MLTDGLTTQVLGTEFSIDTHRQEVTLVKDSVNVGATGLASQPLHPNEQTTLTCDHRLVTRHVDTTPYTMWRDGYLYFDNAEVEEIMQAIGANFNKTVEFRSQKALHCRMRFIAECNSGVTAALEMMNRMQKVKATLDGNKIIVE